MENKPQHLEEDTIDLGKLANVAIDHKKQVGGIIIGCTLLAAGISFILPKQYESTTLVQTRNAGQDISGAAAMAAMMGVNTGASSSATNYMELMKSRRVLEPIINDMEWEDEKKKPEAEDFAKKYLDIKNTKQTDLITVTAKGRTPEEAQKISQGVVDNFLLLQTDMNQQTQSLLVKFLEKRIDEAKKDAEDARTKFAEYQQEHKIYSPDEQAKAAVSKMSAFDEAISNMQVQEKANQAKLDAVGAKLGDISSSSQNYNINDNEIVMGLRKQIVDAQVNLVGLRERYTEEHPSIISAKERIDALQKKLASEVNTIVASKYTTMNSTQAGLIGEQANAEVSVAVAKASETAIRQRREEEEKKLDGFPKAVLEYLNLQRDTSIKEQIYTNLIKQAEDKKLKEAMDSMDIQIVDAANLPDEDKPASPKKILITAIGFVLGCMFAFCYSLVCYRREA
ncbi:GumC family protein [Selenomonas ruminantium]|uniref:Uncharacterized protein involved in exopolysaccharide biosynthesis n=1 Tax=Selenomonas ruminantium TaxID=971 RepID=A0A1H0M870_SELRU|nr:GumC family protein [Selenomonas ruminantium]SDO76491.1 Uncharacterized protein involved in exopolysaccharide biosynthesis [Selenomonas ruminantium]